MGVRKILSMALFSSLLGLTAVDVCLADESIEVVRSEGVLQVGEPDKQATDARVKRLTGNRYVFSTGANGRAVVRVGSAGFVVARTEKTAPGVLVKPNWKAPFARFL